MGGCLKCPNGQCQSTPAGKVLIVLGVSSLSWAAWTSPLARGSATAHFLKSCPASFSSNVLGGDGTHAHRCCRLCYSWNDMCYNCVMSHMLGLEQMLGVSDALGCGWPQQKVPPSCGLVKKEYWCDGWRKTQIERGGRSREANGGHQLHGRGKA